MDGRTGRGAGRGHLPGFAAVEVLYDEQGAVRGVATGDMGVARDGSHTDHYQPGMGCMRVIRCSPKARGQLGRQLIERFKLDDAATPSPTASASRKCGRSIRPNPSPAW